MAAKPTPTPTVPFDTATRDTALWQQLNPDHCKAFLVPTADLLRTLAEMNIISIDPNTGAISGDFSVSNNQDIRAYMAVDTVVYNQYKNDPVELRNHGFAEKLFLVGTQTDPHNSDYLDVMYDEENNVRYPSGTRLTIKGSGIYDFTSPCPTECDPSSPLYHTIK